jgi:hypothetical protein
MLLPALVSALALASAASAAAAAPPQSAVSLVQAVRATEGVSSLRYVITISIARRGRSALTLHVRGTRGRASIAIHVQESSDTLGVSVPGPRQSAILDGPFLYEGAPDGVAVDGTIRWLRVPVARIGQDATPVSMVRSLSPAPLLRVLDEWGRANVRSPDGWYRGTVPYDDPIVLSALSGMTGGVEFRNLRFSAHAGKDDFLHTIRITGRTADGERLLTVDARLYAFGWPVRVDVPAEGTFMDQKLLSLEE